MNRLNTRIVALFILLTFLNRTGLGLYLHNWLHHTTIGHTQHHSSGDINLPGVKCTCIEDALMPLVFTAVRSVPSLPGIWQTVVRLTRLIFYSSPTKIYFSRRGPPVMHLDL